MTAKKKQPKTLDEAYEVVLEELLEMFLKKHHDYGKGNILSIKELGISFRVAEKIERLKNLYLQNDGVTNESIEETWLDIATYGVIAVLYGRGWFQKLEVKKKK
ncbi:MAG: nucleotide modification associated domain-containing protein [Patescibacteria group bacterium]